MAKAKGVLPSFQLFALLQGGTSLETERTLSRPTLTVQDMTVDSAGKPILPSVDTLHCDLRPSPGTAADAANEEKREVLPPWGRCLAVSRSLVRSSVPQLSSFSLRGRAAIFSSPWLEARGFQNGELVTSFPSASPSLLSTLLPGVVYATSRPCLKTCKRAGTRRSASKADGASSTRKSAGLPSAMP